MNAIAETEKEYADQLIDWLQFAVYGIKPINRDTPSIHHGVRHYVAWCRTIRHQADTDSYLDNRVDSLFDGDPCPFNNSDYTAYTGEPDKTKNPKRLAFVRNEIARIRYRQFLRAWLAFSLNPDNNPYNFNRNSGLCSAVSDYGYSDYDMRLSGLGVINSWRFLRERFITLGMDKSYPFHSGYSDLYSIETNRYQNEDRRNFARTELDRNDY